MIIIRSVAYQRKNIEMKLLRVIEVRQNLPSQINPCCFNTKGSDEIVYFWGGSDSENIKKKKKG